jgi:HAD superfamily hydrolase (TIGR01509 family)
MTQSSGLAIRPYRETDESAVISLWDEAFGETSPWNKPKEDIRRKLKIQRELFLVAYLQSQLVGTAMAGFDGHRGWVYSVAVRKEFRRKGIGAALMHAVEDGLRQIGCHKLNLQVRAGNEAVVAFYQNLGYQIEERVSMGKLLVPLAYRQILSEHDIALDESVYAEHWIREGLGITEYVADNGLSLDPEYLQRQKIALYIEMVSKFSEEMPGATALLERLHGRVRLALASSSNSDAITIVLKKLQMHSYFEVIAGRQSVARSKPYPDIFLYVAEMLGVQPWNCLVIEDAEKGVIAANKAGMKSIAVPNAHTQHHNFSKAAMVVNSLDHLNLSIIQSLA